MLLGRTVTPAVQATSSLCPGRLAERARSTAAELAPRSRDPPGSWKCRFGHAPSGMSPQVRVHTRSAACTKVAGKLCRISSQAAFGHPACWQAAWVPGSLVSQSERQFCNKESGQCKIGGPPRALQSRTLNHIEGLGNPSLPEPGRSLPNDIAGCQCSRHLRCCQKPVCYHKHWQACHSHSPARQDAARDGQLSRTSRTRTERHKPG